MSPSANQTSPAASGDIPEISIVIPMMNETESLETLFSRLEKVLAPLGLEYEIVCVNDGSTDDTLPRLRSMQRENSHLRVVDFSRNFGKEAALAAGLFHTRGRCVIPLDADLQDPPELIPEMLEKWRQGFEMVNAVRSQRDSDSFVKRGTAGLFYKCINRISEVRIPQNVGDFRLMDRKVVQALGRLPERTRFNKGLFAWVGFSTANVYYSRPKRETGNSKWKYWALWNLALEGITSFSSLPLRFWSYLGGLVSALAVVYALWVVSKTLIFGIDVPGYASLMVVILFFSGVNLFTLGIFGEYLSRVFIESKQRPLYVVREVHEPPRENSAVPPPESETGSHPAAGHGRGNPEIPT